MHPLRRRLAVVPVLGFLAAACQSGTPTPAAPPPAPAVAATPAAQPSAAVFSIPTAPMAADASPEVRELGRFVGHWVFTGADVPAKPGEPAPQPTTGEMTCAWFTGGRAVICRSVGELGSDNQCQLDFYTYDSTTKSYVVRALDTNGVSASGTLSVQPGALIRTIDWKGDKGVPYRARWIWHNLSLGSGDFVVEFSAPDGPFTPVWKGTIRKTS